MLKNNCEPQTKATGLNRTTVDKFYTCSGVVEMCLDLVNRYMVINKKDLCIEPSAGNGAFVNGIKSLFKNYVFYDLYPENDEIQTQDYLEYSYDKNDKINKVHVIGNPPFGRQSSLAKKFIKKSVEFCDSISFILPKSFKKESLKRTFPLKFHLICQVDLPQNSFIVDEKEYDVPCVFQIWVKKNKNRTVAKKLIPNKYKFVKKNEDHDISFRRVGIKAGEIDKNTKDKSVQSHYFIKFDEELSDDNFERLGSIDYVGKNNTCGPKSISKPELIKEFNKVF